MIPSGTRAPRRTGSFEVFTARSRWGLFGIHQGPSGSVNIQRRTAGVGCDVEGSGWLTASTSLVLARHRDGGHFRRTRMATSYSNKRSLYSLLYLNDCESGGARGSSPGVLRSSSLWMAWQFRWAGGLRVLPCPCAEGTALAFDQDILGEPCIPRRAKYIIRTDTVQEDEPICDKPRDLQAWRSLGGRASGGGWGVPAGSRATSGGIQDEP